MVLTMKDFKWFYLVIGFILVLVALVGYRSTQYQEYSDWCKLAGGVSILDHRGVVLVCIRQEAVITRSANED